MAESAGGERRTEARRLVSWRSQVVDGGGRAVDGRVVDVSPRGLGLLVDASLPFGATVLVNALIPPREPAGAPVPLQVKAKVVFAVMAQGRFRVGVQFVQLDPATRKLLEPFL